MNTATAIGTYIFGFLVVVLIGVVIRRMVRGWRSRAELQAGLIGSLPVLPDQLGPAIVAPNRGLYVGSTLASSRMERINVGDLGYRCKAVLTRYPEGILVERSGASPIWMPQSAVSAVRTERGMAGKVIPVLVIRWRLPSGTEIDTGFRSDDRREYSRWVAS